MATQENSSIIAQPPAEYALFTARKWGEPIMVAQGGYSTELRLNIGSFQVVSCYIPETRQFSSISNHCKLSHEDMVKLANTQLLHFGRPFGMTLQEMRKIENLKLDNFTLKQKMNWIYNAMEKDQSEKPTCEMWGVGEWFETTAGCFGTMIRGGQMVACTKETFDINCKLPNEKAARSVKMRKLLPFRRSDWGKTHQEYPWLVQKCTVANHPKSTYSERSKGIIYGPVALDWNDFPFVGKIVPSAYYIVDDWLVPL